MSNRYNVAHDCQVNNLSQIYEKYFGYPSKGTFVEIGAFDGNLVSNTSCLADHGWNGVYVEPVREYYLKCVQRHENNKNIKVKNCAIGNKEGIETIYVSDCLTTMLNEYPDRYKEMDDFKECNLDFLKQECEQIKLQTLLEQTSVPKNFEVLVVDVEGKEKEVFESFDLNEWRPKMLIVELVDNHPSFQKYNDVVETNSQLRNYILANNYVEIYCDKINTIFVDKKFHNMINNKNVSIICACKNRYEPLKISLSSWLNFEEVKEVIIVDWNSNEPVNHLTKIDPRVKVIRVEGEQYFNQPQPLNLAAKLATQEFLLKLDADYMMNPYYRFFDNYDIDDNTFIFGPDSEYESHINDSPYFKYLRGLLFVKREKFLEVGGYNENMSKYYAWEDDELFTRLRMNGMNSIPLKYNHTMIHIPHPDNKRFENFEGDNEEENKIIERLSKMYSGDELKWQSEYAISQYHLEKNAQTFAPKHHYIESVVKWNIIKIDEQNYFAEKIDDFEPEFSYENSPLKYFPSVYYISLEESLDRRKNLVQQFKNYGITDINGIISKRFKDSNDNVIGEYIHQLNDGTKGCAVSHLKALKHWYDNTQEDYVFVCEDDLSLETVKYWGFTWEEFVESIPEDADCVQLMTIRDKFKTFDIRERMYDDWGASAYIATREYVKKIIDSYCLENEYKLEVVSAGIMPLIENLLFVGLGKVYTVPLFIEDIKFNSTFTEEEDSDVKNGQKNNHIVASNLVLDYWKSKKNEEKVFVEKTEIEELLTDYSLDTENPVNNFKLGLWYWNQEHTAPALSYFLRCAERADDLLAYEALIWASFCYDKQGTRDGSAKVLLQQALTLIPSRPEAYFLLSRFCERREWWQESYIMASQGLIMANFDCQPLNTYVEYPGKYGLLFEKAVSAWWWGKPEESKTTLNNILEEYDVLPEYEKIIKENLEKMGK